MPWVFNRSEHDAPENTLYFGVELEFAVNRLVGDEYRSTLPPWITSDFDSSIDCGPDDLGVEWKFHPSTWLWWWENRWHVMRLLKTLTRLDAESSTQWRCGLHVHFSNVLSVEHLFNVMQFVYSQKNDILALSRRDEQQTDQYSRLYPLADGVWVYDANNQPLPAHLQTCQTCRASETRPIHLVVTDPGPPLRQLLSECLPDDHYDAVNVTDHGTVEVRIFAGALDATEFYGSLEFVKTLIDYTNPNNGYNHETDCNLMHYRRWLHHVSAPDVKRILNQTLGRV